LNEFLIALASKTRSTLKSVVGLNYNYTKQIQYDQNHGNYDQGMDPITGARDPGNIFRKFKAFRNLSLWLNPQPRLD